MLKTLRTQKSAKIYRKYLKGLKSHKKTLCPLCDERVSVKSFKYWRIVKNIFPYDKIANRHDMLLPRRHISENKLNEREIAEYKKIKENYIRNTNYHYIMEANQKMASIPNHFHLHLVELK